VRPRAASFPVAQQGLQGAAEAQEATGGAETFGLGGAGEAALDAP
jgi:hypothetical protein